MADLTVSILGVDGLSGPARSAAASLSGIESAAGRVGGALTSVAAAATKAAVAVGAITFTAVAAGIGAATTSAAGFEKQISAIGAVSGATSAQLKEISALALDLGAKTSFSASEAAKGIEELVKAGVSMTDVMGGAAKASLDLAAAGAISVGEAAEIASNAMNVFGISGAKMGHVADVIAGAANASAISVNDYKFSLAAAGAVAATVGVGFEDLSTAIAVMGQAGIKGSDAGTSLKTMLLNLQPTTKGQIAEFQRLGLVTADGANQFFNAEGKAKSFAEIAGVLKTAMSGMTKQQQLASLELLFGADAIRAAAIMANEGAEGFREMAQAIGLVTASDVAEARLDNLAGSIEKFKGSAETAAITVGLKFTPTLKRLVDLATDGLNRAIPTMEKWAGRMAAGLDTIITRATKAAPGLLLVGGAVLTFGRHLADLASGALPLVTKAVEQFTGFFTSGEATDSLTGFADQAQSAFETLSPVAVAVGQAITTNVIETFRFLQTSVLPPVLSILQQAGDLFMGTLLPAAQQTGGVMRGIFGDTLSWLATTVMPPFLSIVKQTSDWFTTVMLPTLPAVGRSLRTALGETIDWLSKTVWPALTSAATVAWDFISGTIVPAIPGVARVLRDVLGSAIEWVGTTGWPMLVSAGGAFASWVTGTAIPTITQLVEWLGPKIQTGLEWLSSTGWPMIVSGGATLTSWVTGTAIPALTQLVEWLGPKIQAGAEWLGTTGWPMIVSAGETVSTWITGTAIPALTQLVEWLGPKVAAVTEWIMATGWPGVVTAGQAVSEWVTGTAIPALTQLVEWLGPKVSAVVTWVMETGWPTMVSAGEAVSTWITGTAIPALTDLVEWLGPKVSAAVTWITDTGWPAMVTIGGELNTIFKDMTQFATDLWTKLSDSKTWDNLSAAAGKLWDAGKILVETFWPGMKTGADDSWVSLDKFVKLIEGASEFVYYFAAGVEAIAKGLAAIKTATSGLDLPPWLLQIIRGATPAVPGLPGGPSLLDPFLPSGRSNQNQTGQFQTSPLASQPQWSEEQVRATQQRILTEMPKPPAFDPSKSEDQRMKDWAPTLQWLEANTGVSAASWAGLIHAENRFGESDLSAGGNNYLSLTRSPYDTYANPGSSRFPTYPTAEANIARGFGIIAHPENTNYNAAWASRNDPEAFARNLAAGGYMVDEPGFPTSNWLTNSRAGRELWQQNVGGSPVNLNMGSPAGTIPTGPLNGVNLSQTQQAWSGQASDANAICGPYLASLFASAVGRPPTADEARKIAEDYGIYNSANGGSGILNSAGFDEYANHMIQQLNPGTTARVQQTSFGVADNAAIQGMAAEQLAGGSPIVGFNTAGHYFGADAFDPSTGKFHVGGTGTSLKGGSEWMTVAEMEAAMGQVSDVITIVGAASTEAGARVGAMNNDFKGVSSTATSATPGIASTASELSNLGAAAVAGSTQLTSIGAALDPVVAQMDTGATSVSAMTDAIIQQAANQGVATESAGRYAVGLTSQKDALLAVLQGFSQTTPAAAELYTQLSTGAITVEDAAVKFAGLATTTAVSAGAISASVAGMGTETAATVSTMTTGIQTSYDLMTAGGLQSVTDLGTGTLTTVQDMAGTTIATVTDMAGNVTNQSATLANGVTLNMGDMAGGVLTSVTDMGNGVVTTVQDMSGNAITTVTDLQGNVTNQFVTMAGEVVPTAQTMGTDVVTAAGTMNTDTVTAVTDMATNVTGAVSTLASDVSESFGTVVELAGEAASSMEAVGDVEIPAPDVDGVIDALKDVERAAKKASDAVKDITQAEKGGSKGGGGSGLGKRAAGGPVSAWSGYIVGENGPEFFMPTEDGYIIPNHRIKGHRALGGPVSATNPYSPIGTTLDGISGDFGRFIVEDIVRMTNDRAEAVIAELTRVHEDLVALSLGTTHGWESSVAAMGQATGIVRTLLERISTEIAKLPGLLNTINATLGRGGTGGGTTPRPVTPPAAPIILPPQPGDPTRGVTPGPGAGTPRPAPSPPRGVTPGPGGVRPIAPPDPTRGVTPGGGGTRGDTVFDSVIAAATQMYREVSVTTQSMRTVAGTNVEQMSRGVASSTDRMSDDVGTTFANLEEDAFDAFIRKAGEVDDAIGVMAGNIVQALRDIAPYAVDAADDLANAIVEKIGEVRGGSVQQIGLLGSDMATELDRIASAPSGPTKNAHDLGEKLTYAIGLAISDSSETNVVEPLVEAVMDAIDEAIEEAEDRAERVSRSSRAFSLPMGGRSDGPGMAELIAAVNRLETRIANARSIDLTINEAERAPLLQEVAVLESLSRSGT